MASSGAIAARRLVVAALLALFAAPACAIDLVVDSSSGEVFLSNPSGSTAAFDGYQIVSASSALLPIGWDSIADNYDASGDGSVDDTAEWFEIAATPASVAEASAGVGGSTDSSRLTPGQVVSLGLLYDTSIGGSLSTLISSGTSTETADVSFLDLQADYNDDLIIDQADYAVFAATFGSIVDLRADGNGDNIINAADYTIWRDAFGASAVAFTPALAVPEPATLVIALLGAAAVTPGRSPARRCSRAAAS